VGKKTLAVRLGDAKARILLIFLLLVAFSTAIAASVITPWALIVLATAPFYFILIKGITGGAVGARLIPLLGKAGELQLLTALLITFALMITKV
jgi:1,4-dihydroxy-2-naphthoate octaprenyltransferase